MSCAYTTLFRVWFQHAGFDSNYAKSYPSRDTQAAFLTAYTRAASTPLATDAPNHPTCFHANDDDIAAESCTPATNGYTVKNDVPVENGGPHEEEGTTTGGDGYITSPHSQEAFIAALRAEVGRWTLPSHLWWAAWAVVQARYSPIDFDFVDYARLRLEGYRVHKKAFFGGQPSR